MTILPNCPKKKPQQASGSGEIESGETNSNSSHNQHQLQNLGTLPNHIPPTGEGTSRSTLYISSQSPPPCWPSASASVNPREEKRSAHASPSHYEEPHEGGPSHSKRRYRASPLRSVRPKLREHRGSTSPPYPSTSERWNVASLSQHNLTHPLPISTPNLPALSSLPSSLSPQAGPSCSRAGDDDSDEDPTAYNSGDEYETFGEWNLTKEQWEEKERWFEKKMKKKSRIIKKMREDGACLFRAIADQVFGDQEMHSVVRSQCMDYIQRNEDAFAPFVSESFPTYVERKRRNDCYGNHIEIAAMSELYNRIIEVYCYSLEPINIFQGSMQTDNAPIRLSYHRGTHYNSLVDPYNATIGVGLGLPGLQPGQAEKNLLSEATRMSENFHLEKTMLEDKIRATDYEATSEAIEEQVAQQSYLDWLREMEIRNATKGSVSGSESASKSPKDRRSPILPNTTEEGAARASPRVTTSPKPRSSPRTSPSRSSSSALMDLAVPGSSKDPTPCSSKEFEGFTLNERASFLNHLPPDMFGLTEYASEEANILAQVLAASQQEYLDSLKNRIDESSASCSTASSDVVESRACCSSASTNFACETDTITNSATAAVTNIKNDVEATT
ncbi:UNVERIFIED_CONTAM: hypothetical protein RMT77_003921 [Armadillidium vulgare]